MKQSMMILGFWLSIMYAAFAITPLEWKVGHSEEKSKAPVKFVPAQVPGAVQLDIAKAEKYPPYEFADNYKMFAWMEDKFYTYLSSFKSPVSRSNTNVAGPTVRFRLPRWENTDRFVVVLDVEGHPEYSSTYTLLYKSRFRPNRGTNVLNM